jgi:hypothetical protein
VSASEHYVPTAAIRDAVRGREMDVLRAMGIQWNGRSNHIRCPYPDHPDHEPSWRWDDKRKVAFCSCIGTRPGEKQGHSIFDVIATKEGLSFEAAKVRAAEILGRLDLITETKTRNYQRTDAVSLLNPSPENRNDALVWTYLSHRLDIEPDHVPRPATKVVGLKSLPYFDPPERNGGKPVHVGDFPAAVFETVNRDGREHAHRIYLSPGGKGKAKLGAGPNGRRRQPKSGASDNIRLLSLASVVVSDARHHEHSKYRTRRRRATRRKPAARAAYARLRQHALIRAAGGGRTGLVPRRSITEDHGRFDPSLHRPATGTHGSHKYCAAASPSRLAAQGQQHDSEHDMSAADSTEPAESVIQRISAVASA